MEDRQPVRGCMLVLAVVIIASQLMINIKVDASGTSWWSLGLMGCDVPDTIYDACKNCASMAAFNVTSEDQTKKCQDDPATVRAVSRGSRHAILDCQRRFNDSRWNCSTFLSPEIFGKFIRNSTRETALVHSYIMAGLMWALAEACAQQRIVDCPCVKSGTEPTDAEGNLLFYGCDANVDYAMKFINVFAPLPKPDSSSGTTERVNFRNSVVGINLMKQRHRRCRCHGVSGTCTAQTCYEAMMSVESAGEKLVEKYDNAQQIVEPVAIPQDESTVGDMIYKNPSPDFCDANEAIGVPGVRGRECDLNHPTRNCTYMCCGEGNFESQIVEEEVEKCEFIYCCHIVCRITGSEFKHVTKCK